MHLSYVTHICLDLNHCILSLVVCLTPLSCWNLCTVSCSLELTRSWWHHEQCPASLAGIELFCPSDVDEVLMVSPHQEGLCGPDQEVPPLLQRPLNGQKFPVSNSIAAFSGGELPGEEATKMELLIQTRLGQNGSSSHLWGIHLHDKGLGWVGCPWISADENLQSSTWNAPLPSGEGLKGPAG